VRIALDPFMHRHLSLEELPRKVRELGYDWIELCPRGDFLEWFKASRVFPERIKVLKRALAQENVKIASLLPMYRWASDDENERQAAVRHRKRAIFGRSLALRRSTEINTNYPISHFFLAAALARLGRLLEAQSEVRAAHAINPTFTVGGFRGTGPSDNPIVVAGLDRVVDGLRKAGVPEH
jgi:xylose isomerase-like TIM barrel protein